MRPRRKSALLVLSAAALLLPSCSRKSDPRLEGSLRQERNGWIFVHLEGSPSRIGFQHGYLLAEEIADAQKVIALVLEHDTKRPWSFFRDAAQKVFWPKIGEEYRQELAGIAEGVRARGVGLDVWDITALNNFLEFSPYYIRWWEESHGKKATGGPPTRESCSAFVATGSYTRDGRPVIGHNAWTGYMEGARWRIVFDIVPERGHRILMDGFPGLIHSADDFGMNSAGIMITETTISQFHGYDPDGIPEFVRARRAMQYSASIDEFARIMREGNNGGYANNWLVADRKTAEIASLELGLKNVTLQRTRDGYFVGANFPVNEKLAREETTFPVNDPSVSANARRKRWEQLMAEYKGRIDIESGKRFLSDHFDAFAGKEDPNERTLCGHIELSPRGLQPWQPPFAPAGAVQAKVADAAMAERMSFVAAMGHSCGRDFLAAEHLKRHPQFEWQKPFLRDLRSHPWTEFSALRAGE
ncbi:MAG: C45 family peptidase [Bryobacterales bacterium]|nr:phospholipase B family protein [Bryobacteraceae bacterium]MDW8131267.1 C45 family peptidase [Bryobacterales bacterium]